MGARKSIRRRRKLRKTLGVFLIELLVAITFGALITLALLQHFGLLMRNSSSAMNEQYANEIAHSILERVQTLSYSDISKWENDPHSVTINTSSTAYHLPDPRDWPTAIDYSATDLKWTNDAISAKMPDTPAGTNAVATVTAESITSPYPGLKVILSITWHDSQNQSRTIVTGTIVHQDGAKAWAM